MPSHYWYSLFWHYDIISVHAFLNLNARKALDSNARLRSLAVVEDNELPVGR